jgi:aminoglycoside 6'-N-acetyltransferase
MPPTLVPEFRSKTGSMWSVRDVEFRRLERSDFDLVRQWLSAPHVSEWWGEPRDLAGVEAEFGPCVDGVDPTLVFVVTISDGAVTSVPVGIVQSYMLRDTPEYESAVGVLEAAGIDLLIGDFDLIGTGLGKETITRFVREIGWSLFPDAKRYMAGPSVRNVRSRRAFERAGFVYKGLADVPGEPDPEAVMVLERPSATELAAKVG